MKRPVTSLAVLSALFAVLPSTSTLHANPEVWNVHEHSLIGQVNERGNPIINDGLLSLNASPEFSLFAVQISHYIDGMATGSRSTFTVPQAEQSQIIPVGREKYAWRMPNGGSQIFDREEVDAGLNKHNSDGWALNKTAEGAFTVDSTDGWVYSYEDNALVSVKAPTDRVLEFTYDRDSRLRSIVQKENAEAKNEKSVLTVSYDNGRTKELVSGPNSATLSYDSEGRIVAWSKNGAEPTRIYYNGDSRLSQMILPDGSRRNYTEWFGMRLLADDFYRYDYQGDFHIWTTDKIGRKEEAYLKSQNEIVNIGADGKKFIHTYERKPSGYGKLQTIKTESGETLVDISYNKKHLPTLVQERGKLPLSYSYDNQDRLMQVARGTEIIASYSYDGSNQKPSIIKNALGEATQIAYDTKGNPLTVTLADGSMQGYTYDSMGRVTEVILPEGYVAVNQYDTYGRLVKTIAPDGKIHEQSYDEQGAVASHFDGVNKWNYEYDSALRVTGIKRDGKNWQTLDYELQKDGGSLVTAYDPQGHKTQQLYNNFGQLLHEENQYGLTVSYSYDALGQKTGFTDENGSTVSYERDKLGRVIAEINALGQRIDYSYDKDGHLASKSTAEGKTTYSYDKFDRIVGINYGNNQKITYEYDAKWQVVKSATNEVETTYGYDKLGRIITEVNKLTDGSMNGKTYSYNPRGLKASMALTDGQGKNLQLTEYTYDGLKRPTSISVDGQLTVAYSYDQKSMQLAGKIFADGLVQSYSYNPDGSLASIRAIRVTGNPDMLEYTFEWDAQGRLAKRTSVQNNLKDSHLALNSEQSTQAMQDNESSSERLGKSFLQEGFSKTELIYSYDKMGRLASVSSPQDNALNESYQYDATGNITEKTIAGVTSMMNYDKANRLTEMLVYEDTLLKKGYPQTPSQNVSLANNESFAEQTDIVRKNGSSFERIGDAFFQEKVSKYSYQYDQAGRLSKELVNDATVASYQYGYLDKVLNVTRDGVTAQFAYDARGMVAAKTVTTSLDSSLPSPLSSEVWQYDGLALARRGNEAYINEASIVGGTTLMKKDLNQRSETYYLNDHLGTTLASIDAQESKTLHATAFGESNHDIRYTGKSYDSELGAYVYAYRNYRADLGRWMTTDPAGYPDGTNNYRYAATPNNSFDLWGLASYYSVKCQHKYYNEEGRNVGSASAGGDSGMTEMLKATHVDVNKKNALEEMERALAKAKATNPNAYIEWTNSDDPGQCHACGLQSTLKNKKCNGCSFMKKNTTGSIVE